MSVPSPERIAEIERFLAGAGWEGAAHRPLADDASFRRYERVTRGADRAVLMDAPPDREPVAPFLRVARLLRGLGLSAPAILAEDPAHGFLLLEDFGDRTMTRLLAEGEAEAPLYGLALDALIHLHRGFSTRDAAAADLPRYDMALYLREAALFTDWYWPAVTGRPCPEAARTAYLGHVANALEAASGGFDTLVLRDYHVDNVMRLDGRPGVAACGLLDFQDAVIGPAAYDLVSLFEDARRDVTPAVSQDLMRRYFEAFPTLDPAAFAASYSALGAQRALKILGIFTRLDRRDGKPQYLRHIPRVWGWLEKDLAHPALAGLAGFVADAFPADRRVAPAAAPGVWAAGPPG
ncbi:phosphotransferase [Marivibrio halodurans]|uniref:Phosphotransferase n=1 Tax=Marivibrio halodurans TaxID=2039722 RepID=A0A8J7S898_9PROT|nr:phosphotransferase [Marivibrio halodurans]MBP5858699.1 phosphotransferase [Marivibrio halodurans]